MTQEYKETKVCICFACLVLFELMPFTKSSTKADSHSLTHASSSPPQTTATGLLFSAQPSQNICGRRMQRWLAVAGLCRRLAGCVRLCRNANGAVQMLLIVSCEMRSLPGWFSARSYEGCMESLDLLLTDDFTITTTPQLCNYSKKCCLVTL